MDSRGEEKGWEGREGQEWRVEGRSGEGREGEEKRGEGENV